MVSFGFYDSINRDRTYNAADMCRIFDGIITNGVFAGVGDKLALNAENTENGMYISVGTGMAWFNGTWTYNDAPIFLEVQPNNSGSRRNDYIELIVDKRLGNQYSSYGRRNRIIISPNSMYVPETDEVFVHHLGYVSVDPGVTVINQNKITSFIGGASCPYVTAAQSIRLDEFTQHIEAYIQQYLNDEIAPTVDDWFEGLIEDYLRDHPSLTSVSLADLGCGRATCSTASNMFAKQITIEGYKLIDGGKIAVYFEHSIVPPSATLNISDGTNWLGAKSIYCRRSSTLTEGIVDDGDTVLLMYNASLNSGNGGYEIIAFDKRSSGSTKPDGGWTENDLHADVQAKLNRIQNGYATSNNTSSTVARTAALTDYALVTGSSLKVKFTTAVNVSNPTLNVNSTGAKAVYLNGSAVPSGTIKANDIVTLVYDGTRYNITSIDSAVSKALDALPAANFKPEKIGGGFAVTTDYGVTTAVTANLADYVPTVGGIVVVRFTHDVLANSTLNINGVGAAPIYFNGSPITDDVIHSGDRVAFFNDGNYLHLIANTAWPNPYYGAANVGLPLVVGSSGFPIIGAWPGSGGGATTLPELGGGYAASSNAASTVARTATISGYVLTVGNGPVIKFTNGITASNATFNVNNGTSNTGAKPIWYKGAALASGVVTSGALVKMVYDGTHYCIESIDTTATEAYVDSAVKAKIMTMTQSGTTYTTGQANFSFTTLDDIIAMVTAGETIWLVNTTTGSIYRTINARGVASTGRLTFAGETLESDNGDLAVEAFIMDGSGTITRKTLSTQSSGGGSYTPETVTLTMTVGATTELSVALSYADLSAKIAAGARLVSQTTVVYDTIGFEWHVNIGNVSQQSISLYTIFEDTTGENLLIAYLSETGAGQMSGVVESYPVGNAKNPTVTPKTGASQSFGLADNTIYECGTLTALTITSAPASGSSIITFTSGSTATNASFPATVLFSADQPDVVEVNGVLTFVPSANYDYEVNIRNRKAMIFRWAVSA